MQSNNRIPEEGFIDHKNGVDLALGGEGQNVFGIKEWKSWLYNLMPLK